MPKAPSACTAELGLSYTGLRQTFSALYGVPRLGTGHNICMDCNTLHDYAGVVYSKSTCEEAHQVLGNMAPHIILEVVNQHV